VYNLLEGMFTLLVVNAQHMKAVPGRKTDIKDAEWIADLLRHGLVKASFIPDRSQRELRELTRYRRRLIQERSQVVNRIQKVLEGANIKLASVATDVTGISGRAMLEAMARGVEDSRVLARMAAGKLKNKTMALEEALQGQVRDHQRLLLSSQLRHVSFLDDEISRLDGEVAVRMRPAEDMMKRMDDIPGVGRRAAEDILAEVGTDMSRFSTAAHLASWAKVCPGNHESAGKRKSGSTGRGNIWLRPILVQAARAASRTKGTYLAAQYRRLAGRRGSKRAIMSVAHTILVTAYHMLSRGTTYSDLGANYFDERERQAVLRRSVRRIEALGYTVTLDVA
jgi:transposase